jgi:outer membrane biosynthesis protein TonB
VSKHIFVSHSHEDSAAADLIVKAIEERGVTCWVAPRDVPPGGSYAEALLEAIEGASCFVLIYSAHSNVSSHVLREVERALRFGINIVPVRFDDSSPSKSLDYLLATVHWLSVAPESGGRSVGQAAEQIAALVGKTHVARPRPEPDRASPPPVPTPAVAEKSNALPWIVAAILLALVTGLIGFLFSRNQPKTETSPPPPVAATTPVATLSSATPPQVASTQIATPASTPRPEPTQQQQTPTPVPPTPAIEATAPPTAPTSAAPSVSRQAVRGVVQDPDGIANVRQQPSLQAKIIGVVKDGEKVEIVGMEGDWVHIVLGPDKSGYIHKSRVKIGR